MKSFNKLSKLAAVFAMVMVFASCGKEDLTPPIISLDGDAIVILPLGGTYFDPGYTASDDQDGDLTGNVIVDDASVDTDLVGKYMVTYSVSDEAGNQDETTREVWVVATSAAYTGNYNCAGTLDALAYTYTTTVDSSTTTVGRILISNLGDYESFGASPYFINGDISGDLGNTFSFNQVESGLTFNGTGSLSADGSQIDLTYTVNDGTTTSDHIETMTKL